MIRFHVLPVALLTLAGTCYAASESASPPLKFRVEWEQIDFNVNGSRPRKRTKVLSSEEFASCIVDTLFSRINKHAYFAIPPFESVIRLITRERSSTGTTTITMWTFTVEDTGSEAHVRNNFGQTRSKQVFEEFAKKFEAKCGGMIQEDQRILSLNSLEEWELPLEWTVPLEDEESEEKWDDRQFRDLARSLPKGTKVMVRGDAVHYFETGQFTLTGVVESPIPCPSGDPKLSVRFEKYGALKKPYVKAVPLQNVTVLKDQPYRSAKGRSRSSSKSRL